MSVVYTIKDGFLEDSNDVSQAEDSQNEGEGTTSQANGYAQVKPTEGQLKLNTFWNKVAEDVKHIKAVDCGNQVLPLARIKKIMKLDEDVKMISAEAPILFAKATEIFIHELTLRAWLHTEDNKRRTLQRNDIAMAISKFDQFDFLIDIVPREEQAKPRKEPDIKQVIETQEQQQVYYVQIPQQQDQSGIQTTIVQSPQQSTIQLQQTSNGMQTTTSPIQSQQQQIMLTPQQQSPQQSQMQTGFLQLANNPNQFQLVQQVMTSNGEIQQIPIPLTQQQMNMLRAQMAPQPIIIQQPQYFQTQNGQNIAIPMNMQQPMFINASSLQQQPQIQIHQQQQPQQVHIKEDSSND